MMRMMLTGRCRCGQVPGGQSSSQLWWVCQWS